MILDKAFRYFSWVTILATFGIVILLGYWELFPYRVIDIKTSPYPILNPDKTVSRGDRVRYSVNACKYVETVPYLKKFLVDGVIYELTDSIGAVPKGCAITVIDVYIPRAIPVGVYRLKFIAHYQVNPIRNVEITNYSEVFTVK